MLLLLLSHYFGTNAAIDCNNNVEIRLNELTDDRFNIFYVIYIIFRISAI